MILLHEGDHHASNKALVLSLEKLSKFKYDNITLKPILFLARGYYNTSELDRLEKYYKEFKKLKLKAH